MVVPLILWLLLTFDFPCQPQRIQQFELGSDRTISIYEECGWRELSSIIYYDVQAGDTRVIPISEIGYYELAEVDQLTFEVIEAEAGNLIGILETSTEPQLIIVHDFVSNFSWPHENNYYYDSPEQERPYVDPAWLDTVERLQQANPHIRLRPELID
jgi:hypothetical protein